MPTSFLILLVGDVRLALPLSEVREILPLLPIERPPGLPGPLIGFITVRGEALPVIAPLLMLEPMSKMESVDLFAHIVRLHGPSDTRPCLLVDRVEDALDVESDHALPIDPSHSMNGALTGELRLDGNVAHIVALDRLLLDAERSALARLTAQAQSRLGQWTSV